MAKQLLTAQSILRQLFATLLIETLQIGGEFLRGFRGFFGSN